MHGVAGSIALNQPNLQHGRPCSNYKKYYHFTKQGPGSEIVRIKLDKIRPHGNGSGSRKRDRPQQGGRRIRFDFPKRLEKTHEEKES